MKQELALTPYKIYYSYVNIIIFFRVNFFEIFNRKFYKNLKIFVFNILNDIFLYNSACFYFFKEFMQKKLISTETFIGKSASIFKKLTHYDCCWDYLSYYILIWYQSDKEINVSNNVRYL